MPLQLPDLDDRRWTDLVDEGRALIPLFSPGWTDHNLHDPGITFMELLASEAELDLYRINRVPPAHVRKFLALVGADPRPPRAARTVLAFRLHPGKPPRVLPAGLELATRDLAGVRTVFRTLEPVTVVDLGLQAIQSGPGGGPLADLTARWRRGESLAIFGDDPAPGAALYLGFDRTLPVGTRVSLVFSLTGGSQEERERLIEEARRAAEGCPPPGPVPPCRCGKEPAEPRPSSPLPLGVPPHPSARTVWEILVGPGVWRRLEEGSGEVADDTRSLTLDGRVEIAVPAPMAAGRLGPVKADLHYLRCRLAGGAWDAPPELVGLALNGAAAEQAESVDREIGQGSGEPHQQLALPRAAVQDGILELTTTENGRDVRWTLRPDFDLSGRADSHFVLDPALARVTFGDGERGRRLPAAVPVHARYRATRAADGNLPAGRIFDVAAFPELSEARNPVPAEGGAAAETLEETAARAVDSVERPLRAVTLADCERLALETPGVRLARAVALANFDPAFPCFQATGVITVIILPPLPRRLPFPSAGTRRAVAGYLARRRLIGTRIAVAGPTYVEIAVRAAVRPLPGMDPAELRRRIVDALDRFFHPLGWPLGRDVYRSEVLQALDETPGVDHVLELELLAGGGATCGNVCLGATGLVAAGEHEIDIERRPA